LKHIQVFASEAFGNRAANPKELEGGGREGVQRGLSERGGNHDRRIPGRRLPKPKINKVGRRGLEPQYHVLDRPKAGPKGGWKFGLKKARISKHRQEGECRRKGKGMKEAKIREYQQKFCDRGNLGGQKKKKYRKEGNDEEPSGGGRARRTPSFAKKKHLFFFLSAQPEARQWERFQGAEKGKCSKRGRTNARKAHRIWVETMEEGSSGKKLGSLETTIR